MLYDSLNNFAGFDEPGPSAPPKKAKKAKGKSKEKDGTTDETVAEDEDDKVTLLLSIVSFTLWVNPLIFIQISFTREEVMFMVQAMEKADLHQRERLRVVQVACTQGWGLARHLSAVQQGTSLFVTLSLSFLADGQFLYFRRT